MARVDKAIPLIQATYAFDKSRDEWLEGVSAAAEPLLNMGEGIVICDYHCPPGSVRPIMDRILQVATSRDLDWIVRTTTALSPTEQAARSILLPGFVDTLLRGNPDMTPMRLKVIQWGLARFGVSDVFGVGASATPGRGLMLTAAVPLGEPPDNAFANLWQHLAAHVRCALRLYDRLDTAEQDAVLEPGTGRVLHAEPSAKDAGVRERLREQARAIDRAQSQKGRSDPENSLRMWRGLVDGTWSLIDRFDADGRRFLVARRNEPHTLDPRRLAKREWQVSFLCATGASNKQIAYELGIKESTVSTHLSRAMRKLGCRNRVELADIAGKAWAEDAP